MPSGIEEGDDIDFYNNLKRAVDDQHLNEEDDMALDMQPPGKQDLLDDDDQYDDGDFINDDFEDDDDMGFMQNMGNGMINK
jgi:hypothetical protein